MKNTYYYIVTLAMLILAFPVKAASEAEFGKLSKAYTLHADGSQEMRVQKELTLFTHAAMNRVYGERFIIYNSEFHTRLPKMPSLRCFLPQRQMLLLITA